MEKKGNLSDLPFIIVFLFALVIVGYLSYIVVSSFADANITAGSLGNTTVVNQTLAAGVTFFGGTLDSLIFWAAIMLGLALVVSAYFIKTHPVFLFGGGIFVVIFTLIIGSGFSDIMAGITGSSALDSVRGNFAISNALFTNLPLILLFLAGLAMIALYAKGVLGGNS